MEVKTTATILIIGDEVPGTSLKSDLYASHTVGADDFHLSIISTSLYGRGSAHLTRAQIKELVISLQAMMRME